LLIAAKTCNKLPAFDRKNNAILHAGLRPLKNFQFCGPTRRPVIKLVLFLQGYRPGKATGRARLPGKAAGQGCRARLLSTRSTTKQNIQILYIKKFSILHITTKFWYNTVMME
jgi:hypothetical protein